MHLFFFNDLYRLAKAIQSYPTLRNWNRFELSNVIAFASSSYFLFSFNSTLGRSFNTDVILPMLAKLFIPAEL